jgi:dephospho-CoA kinase
MTRKVKAKQVKKPLKKVIILTGPSGAGKSELARLLGRKGFRILKGDSIAKGFYKPGTPLMRALRSAFGPEIFDRGRLLRPKLAALAFASPKSLKRLNALVHPALIREIRRRLAPASKAVVDMAVYFSAGAPRFGGKVLLIDAPRALREKRLVERGLSPAAAARQAAALKFSAGERARCAAVIVNSGSREALKRRLEAALSALF